MVGLDVKAMRSQPAEKSHLHLQHSREIFLDLVDVCHGINRDAWKAWVDARDYEGLERLVVAALLNR